MKQKKRVKEGLVPADVLSLTQMGTVSIGSAGAGSVGASGVGTGAIVVGGGGGSGSSCGSNSGGTGVIGPATILTTGATKDQPITSTSPTTRILSITSGISNPEHNNAAGLLKCPVDVKLPSTKDNAQQQHSLSVDSC